MKKIDKRYSMRDRIVSILLLALAVCLAGCQQVTDYGQTVRSTAETQIKNRATDLADQLRLTAEAQINQQIEGAKARAERELNARIQAYTDAQLAEVENYLQGYMAQQGIKVDVDSPEYKAFLQKVLQDNYPELTDPNNPMAGKISQYIRDYLDKPR